MSNILLIGHSFVNRYRTHLLEFNGLGPRTSQHFDFGATIGLPLEHVYVCGRSGLGTSSNDLDFIRQKVTSFRPDVVILELGTNDLASSNVSGAPDFIFANSVADKVINFAEELRYRWGVRSVVSCLVVKRRRCRGRTVESEFDRRRCRFNARIKAAAAGRPYLRAYKHDRTVLVNLSSRYCADDIHITSRRGMELYNHSMRKAVTLGLGVLRNN